MKLRSALIGVAVALCLATEQGLAVTGTGTPRADTLRGTRANDILLGRGGNDRLIGLGGSDVLAGGPGRDTIVCGPGLDAVIADRGDTIGASCELVAGGAARRDSRSSTPPKASTPTSDGDEGGNDTSATDEILLGWLFPEEGDPNWTEGVVLFLLGAVGAAVIGFLYLGEFLPSTGGKAEYESDTFDLGVKKEERDKLHVERAQAARATPVDETRLRALEGMVDDLTSEIDQIQTRRTAERWRLFGIGVTFYVILGGAFATMFATTLLQALLVGFGWVAVADRLGLKRETKERDDLRGKQIKTVEQAAERATQEAATLKIERDALKATVAAGDERAKRTRRELAQLRRRVTEAEAKTATYVGAIDTLSRQIVSSQRTATPESEQ